MAHGVALVSRSGWVAHTDRHSTRGAVRMRVLGHSPRLYLLLAPKPGAGLCDGGSGVDALRGWLVCRPPVEGLSRPSCPRCRPSFPGLWPVEVCVLGGDRAALCGGWLE